MFTFDMHFRGSILVVQSNLLWGYGLMNEWRLLCDAFFYR